MNTVVFSEVKAACLAVSTLSTQLEEIIKNKLKEVLGKYKTIHIVIGMCI